MDDEGDVFSEPVYYQRRFFAENLHDTIQKNLNILRKHMYEENLARNMVRLHSILTHNAKVNKESVVGLIKKALTQLLKTKPDKPLEFLKRYFINLRKGRDLTEK